MDETSERLEARRWVQRAIVFYESTGKEKTLAQIADPKGPYVDGDRYIFALDIEGKLLAHPFSKRLMGRNLTDLRDSEGRCFIRKLLAKATAKGYGFVDYVWPLPISEEERFKTAFFERVDGMVLCSGFYAPESVTIAEMYMRFGPYGPC